ncbi:hypothetical protein HDIA_0918 [Hartmannibacter diazotrophicus]|uniref:Uncharacterized protein n=1 Tax=Hartmannibacter diazotrophicus TaxID=1482074 RepID=A0A2C9D2P4_9HYPH|nr:hypothetical protein [Hartmannibacter diazotrophicus]SON54459.1 hypothetical protein HDIA_0918 [Hartmannibacter diazotrophicus]
MIRKRHLAALLAGSLALGAATPASAFGDPEDPNWPCQQRKVPELSLGAIWTGPDIEPFEATWREDKNINDLVPLIAARRTTLDEVQSAIDDFAKGADKERLMKLFAGVFVTLDSERTEVMRGIDRFAKKQKQMAADLRQQTREIDKLRDAPGADQTKINQAYDDLNLKTRVFGDRQHSLTFVCEVPVIIEKRAYSIGRIISEKLQKD